jgi:hypothetical protein
MTEIGDAMERVRNGGWQPIETLPHPNSKAMFWLDWADDCAALNPGHPHYDVRLFVGMNGCWSSLYKATHWQPLPAPPNQ